jgi:hypothetical protein
MSVNRAPNWNSTPKRRRSEQILTLQIRYRQAVDDHTSSAAGAAPMSRRIVVLPQPDPPDRDDLPRGIDIEIP